MTIESIEAGWFEAITSGPLAGIFSSPQAEYDFTKRGRSQRAPAGSPASATAQSRPIPTSAVARAALPKVRRISLFATADCGSAKAFTSSQISVSVRAWISLSCVIILGCVFDRETRRSVYHLCRIRRGVRATSNGLRSGQHRSEKGRILFESDLV